jgi:hypothetical protein
LAIEVWTRSSSLNRRSVRYICRYERLSRSNAALFLVQTLRRNGCGNDDARSVRDLSHRRTEMALN